MSELGWLVVSPWLWRQPRVQSRLCLEPQRREFSSAGWDAQLRAVRESWRHARWDDYLNSNRHEVAVMRGPSYCERAAQVRRVATGADKHIASVLTGGFVSPEHLTRAKQQQGLQESQGCPYCGCEPATFKHVAWQCVPCPHARPPRAQDAVQARLGWGSAHSGPRAPRRGV